MTSPNQVLTHAAHAARAKGPGQGKQMTNEYINVDKQLSITSDCLQKHYLYYLSTEK